MEDKKSFEIEEKGYKNILLRIYDIGNNEVHFVNFNEKSMGALTTHQQMIDQAVKVGNRHINPNWKIDEENERVKDGK